MNIITGSSDDTVNVLGTGVLTSLSTSGGNDTVNVGNAGSVQGILGALTIQNPGSGVSTSVQVDDSADSVARTVTLSTFVSGGQFQDAITGLAPGMISYNDTFEGQASITTGKGNDTVNVLGTGVVTNLSTTNGHDTVNVGNDGSVQGINQNLTILQPARLRHAQRQRLGRRDGGALGAKHERLGPGRAQRAG